MVHTRGLQRAVDSLASLFGFISQAERLRDALSRLTGASLARLETCDSPEDLLLRACRLGLTPLCSAIVIARPSLSGAQLGFSAGAGHEDRVRELLALGAAVEGVDGRGRTALMALADAPLDDAARQLRIARLLLEAGCPVDHRDLQGRCALHLAISQRNYSLAGLLMDMGASLEPEGPGFSVVYHLAADCSTHPGDTDFAALARRLVAHGATLNTQHEQGITPLMFLGSLLSKSGLRSQPMMELMEALLDLGADATALDLRQRDVLNYLVTCLEGEVDVGRLSHVLGRLVAAGADPNRVDMRGTTSLGYMAVLVCMTDVQPADALLQALIRAGANARAAVPEGLLPTVLKVAGRNPPHDHVPDIIRTLVAAGCRADAPAPGGISLVQLWLQTTWVLPQSPWPMQVTHRQLDCLRALLDCGCPLAFPPRLPDDGPDVADAAHAVVAAGATPATAAANDAEGARVLAAAVASGSIELVRMLVTAAPAAVRGMMQPSRWTALEQATAQFCLRLEDMLPLPPEAPMGVAYATLVLKYCRMARVLLEAGSPPVLGGLIELHNLPDWARRRLSFLPLLAENASWNPYRHSAFPQDFRQAARTLIMINARGFGARLAASGEEAGGGGCCRRVTRAAKRARRGHVRPCTGVQLPQDVLLHILDLAAFPLLDWVPDLQAFRGEDSVDV